MSKAIMISIKPKYVADILNGKKTIEIRKTCPQVFKNLKPYEGCSIDVYIYCTKEKEVVMENIQETKYITHTGKFARNLKTKYHSEKYPILNGKVVAKFTLNKVEEISWQIGVYELEQQWFSDFLDKCCLGFCQLKNYLNKKNGYAWHIDNLVIFDEPKELSEFRKQDTPSYEQTKPFAEMFGDKYTREEYMEQCKMFGYVLTKAPQNWCYVEGLL